MHLVEYFTLNGSSFLIDAKQVEGSALEKHLHSVLHRFKSIFSDPAMIDQVIETFILLAKCVALTVVGTIKALLPMGVLPRKNVRGMILCIFCLNRLSSPLSI